VSCKRTCHIHPQVAREQVADLRQSFEEEWLVGLQQGLMVQHSCYRILDGMLQVFLSKGISFMYLFETSILDGMPHA
jgi:hypothetical protein